MFSSIARALLLCCQPILDHSQRVAVSKQR